MRIGINAFPLRRNGGGARYVFSGLLSALLRLDHTHHYVIFSHLEGLHLIYQVLRAHGETLGGTGPDPRVRVIHIQEEGQIYGHRYEFDLYFGPLNNLNPRLYDRPTVAILHDIQEQYHPENFSKQELAGRREVYPDICRSATTLIAISEFCKQSFVEKFGIDPGKIEVVYNAPQAGIVGGPLEDGGAAAVDDGHWSRDPLPQDFLFYPANTYPHKNHALLLDALQRLRDAPADGGATPRPPQVVFSGFEIPGSYPLRKEIAARRLGDFCRIYTDVPVEELRYLYRHARAVALPTKFEGFGMPVVEAAACGRPVLCSDLPVLREILGDNALYFDPDDVGALVGQIRKVYEDEGLRQQLAAAGPPAAARFNWDASGRRMLQVFADAPYRFAWGRRTPGSVKRPRIGVLLRLPYQGRRLVASIESLLTSGYPDLVIQLAPGSEADLTPENLKFLKSAGVFHREPPLGESDDAPAHQHGNGRADADADAKAAPPDRIDQLLDFAREHDLDMVGEMIEGHRFKISAMDSVGWAYLTAPDKAVHIGEAMEWRGDAFIRPARMRLTGDGLRKIEGFLYPEMLFYNRRALEAWPEGPRRAAEGGEEWRWELLRAAHHAGQLFMSQRLLADCNQNTIVSSDGKQTLRAGGHYYDTDGTPILKQGLLRRAEPALKRAAGILPMRLQHAGTRIWYRLYRISR